MDSKQLYLADGSSVPIWYCGKCGTVFGEKSSLRRLTPEQSAEQCCKPAKCERCECEIPKGGTRLCDTCRPIQKAEEYQAKYEAATKLKPLEYDGYVWDHRNDTYYQNVEQLLSDVDEVPDWVFACSESEPRRVDTDDITELMFEESFDDAADYAEGTEELGRALDVFWEKNRKIVSYYPDYSRVVILK
jgi:hypothetical protein